MSIRRHAATKKARDTAVDEPLLGGRRHKPDYMIVLLVGILVLIGLVVLYAISPARVEMMNQNADSALAQTHFMQKQVLYLFVGLVAFVVASRIPFSLWRKYGTKLVLGGFALCLVLAILGLFLDGGPIIKTNGAVRWFNLGFVSFQPSEVLKFGLLFFAAGFLARRVKDGSLNDLHATLVPLGFVVGIAALFIIVFQKDMGTGVTMLGMLGAMLFVAGLNARRMLLIAGVGLLSVVALVVTSPHRIARVVTFLDPSQGGATSSYHINQAAIALGSGGAFGRGLGNSVQAFGYLPEAVNDSIFAILGETFGFFGVALILVLFFLLLKRILDISEHTLSVEARLVVAGVFGLLATHVAVNVGSMIGIFPLTGVTLPFLSFGGTSLLFTMIDLGIVFSISRYTSHKELTLTKEGVNEAGRSRRGIGRTRHAGARRFERAR